MFPLFFIRIRLFLMVFLFVLLSSGAEAQLVLEPHHIILKKGIALDLNIPKGYHISVAADGMHRLRFLAKSPDGQLFCTDMHNLADNNSGKIYLFENWSDSAKCFKKTTVFATGLRNPNQVLFYKDKGINYIYIAETHRLSRYVYHYSGTSRAVWRSTMAKFM
jgi:hypothetical protein